MKRPASVTAATVVLSILLLMSLLPLASLPRGRVTLGVLLVAPVMPFLHAAPLYGLLRRARWSRAFAVAVLSLWSAVFLAVAVWQAVRLGQPVQMLPGVIGGGLLAWLVASLLRNPDVLLYLAKPTASSLPSPGVPQTASQVPTAPSQSNGAA